MQLLNLYRSREYPAVGLSHAGVRAEIVKSVNRIFYRSAINQGLLHIVNHKILESYKKYDMLVLDFQEEVVPIDEKYFEIPALPDKLQQIIKYKGLINWIRTMI